MLMSEEPSAKGNILIVDDTPSNLRLLSSMLHQHGYGVRSAISGLMALRAVERIHPDLVLLDINMPIMDGYEVCTQLKLNEKTKTIPIIFLSALGETSDKVKAFQVGGADYITKPFQVEEVLARVENQLVLRRAQLELERAKGEALRALEQEQELNRLRSEFVAMISHDFRTPLTSIRGFTELLRMSPHPPDTQARYFNKIDTAIDHLLNLLDEVLRLGSVETSQLQRQPTALQQFCQEVVELLQTEVDRPCEIQFSYAAECTVVEVDQTLLRQILINLLTNAIKYSPAGELVELRVTSPRNYQDAVQFQICDRGIGIPLASQPYLFDAFYRGSNVGEIRGTGLGLAIVKRCVEVYQGQIQFDSQEGMGTTVTVTLPLLGMECKDGAD
ncbi:hybrid sensor histidine kinase/response regulator [Phormidium tenue FACHB-886]|nr:hybrid sensor histidine kinase/response regulator [Phormidium tenue FACHB-886]